jgi:hypothetical protein
VKVGMNLYFCVPETDVHYRTFRTLRLLLRRFVTTVA